MAIEYPQGISSKLAVANHYMSQLDPRIEKVLDYLGRYQSTLGRVFAELPDYAKRRLGGPSNPHLARGPMELVACTNGVVASILNGFTADLTATVSIPDVHDQTIIDYLNSIRESLFTFIDPISKLSAVGYSVRFDDAPVYDGLLMNLIITDRQDRRWFPRASKVMVIGWQFFEHGDYLAKADDAARQSVSNALGHANLRSPANAQELLTHYRTLLDSATSEADLQQFLEAHPEFVYPEHEVAMSKPSLGGERQPDFGFSIRSAFGARWIFVEIEKPTKSIFTVSVRRRPSLQIRARCGV